VTGDLTRLSRPILRMLNRR